MGTANVFSKRSGSWELGVGSSQKNRISNGKWVMGNGKFPNHFPFHIYHAPFAILRLSTHCFLPTAYCFLPTPYSQLPTPRSSPHPTYRNPSTIFLREALYAGTTELTNPSVAATVSAATTVGTVTLIPARKRPVWG